MISPDGLRLAFVGYDAGGTQRLYVGTLGARDSAEPLAKTEGASLPFWSPDSRAIGFFAQGSLKTIDIFTRGAANPRPCGRRTRRHLEPRWRDRLRAESS